MSKEVPFCQVRYMDLQDAPNWGVRFPQIPPLSRNNALRYFLLLIQSTKMLVHYKTLLICRDLQEVFKRSLSNCNLEVKVWRCWWSWWRKKAIFCLWICTFCLLNLHLVCIYTCSVCACVGHMAKERGISWIANKWTDSLPLATTITIKEVLYRDHKGV